MPSRTWGFSSRGAMTAWIKTTNTSGTVASLYHGRVQDEVTLLLVDGKIGIFVCTREFVYTARVSTTRVNTGEWVFVAGVLDGENVPANLRIYVNGREETGTVMSQGQVALLSDATPRAVRIGWRTNEWPPELYKGLIDDVAIFNRALTPEEIAGIYRGGPLGAGAAEEEDDPAALAVEPDEEVALSTTPRVLYENYTGVWEDTKRARQQGLPLNVRFQEPPQSGAAFGIPTPHVITKITTFHWYGGNGANPVAIGVRKMDGGYEKSWPASGEKDFTRSVTVYWVVEPNERLEAGDYEVNAAPPNTWSANRRSNLKGIVRVEGYAAPKDGGVKPPGSKTIVREYPITPGIPVSGQVEAPSQIHKYSFRAEAGRRITVSIEAEPRLGVRADLMNPAGTKVARKLAKRAPRPATFTFLARVGGVYEVRVWVKNTQFKSGSYTVSVKLE